MTFCCSLATGLFSSFTLEMGKNRCRSQSSFLNLPSYHIHNNNIAAFSYFFQNFLIIMACLRQFAFSDLLLSVILSDVMNIHDFDWSSPAKASLSRTFQVSWRVPFKCCGVYILQTDLHEISRVNPNIKMAILKVSSLV